MTASRIVLAVLAAAMPCSVSPESYQPAKTVYVTLEIGRNLVVVEGEAVWRPVGRLYWQDKVLTFGVTASGPMASLEVKGKATEIDREAALHLIRTVEEIMMALEVIEKWRK